MSSPLQPSKLPIFDDASFPLHYLNTLFSNFDRQYKSLAVHYSDNSHPEFMRDCFGQGIPASFASTLALLEMQRKKTPPASRVGAAISAYHTEIRNCAKRWGAFWDSNQPDIDRDFASVLDYVLKCEEPSLPAGVKFPEVLKDGRNTIDYMIEKFNNMKQVRIAGRDAPIPNKIVIQSRGDTEVDDGAKAIQYEVSMAAVLWGIREAGMSIKGRPANSILRQFLQKAIGTADDAGLRLVELHEWAPEIFRDYKREVIARALQDQQYWIQTAATVENILGHESRLYKDVLALIGADTHIHTLRSANKTAILTYALAEKLECIRKKDFAGESDPSFQGMIADLRELATQLALVGKEAKTEERLQQAKVPHIAPAAYYAKVDKIFTDQGPSLVKLFERHPEFISTIEHLKKYIPKLRSAKDCNDEMVHVIELISDFCHAHTQSNIRSSSRATSPRDFSGP